MIGENICNNTVFYKLYPKTIAYTWLLITILVAMLLDPGCQRGGLQRWHAGPGC